MDIPFFGPIFGPNLRIRFFKREYFGVYRVDNLIAAVKRITFPSPRVPVFYGHGRHVDILVAYRVFAGFVYLAVHHKGNGVHLFPISVYVDKRNVLGGYKASFRAVCDIRAGRELRSCRDNNHISRNRFCHVEIESIGMRPHLQMAVHVSVFCRRTFAKSHAIIGNLRQSIQGSDCCVFKALVCRSIIGSGELNTQTVVVVAVHSNANFRFIKYDCFSPSAAVEFIRNRFSRYVHKLGRTVYVCARRELRAFRDYNRISSVRRCHREINGIGASPHLQQHLPVVCRAKTILQRYVIVRNARQRI